MGILSDADAKAKQFGNRKAAASGVSDMSQVTDQVLDRLPIELREKVLKQAMRAGGRVIATQYRKEIKPHRSRQTGSRDSWSNEVERERASWHRDLYMSTSVVVKIYETTVVAHIGPRLPEGAHGYLVEMGTTIETWGTGPKVTLPPGGQMRRAGRQAHPRAVGAVVKKIKDNWGRV